MIMAAIDKPQFPRPASTPCAKPMSRGLDQSDVMWVPTTKPVPAKLNRSLEMSICVYVVENAKAKHGMAITTMMILKVFLGPNLSVSRPTMIRPGAVRAPFVRK